MTGTTILAIDLGKYKCVACTYDRATAAAEFRTITTSRALTDPASGEKLLITLFLSASVVQS